MPPVFSFYANGTSFRYNRYDDYPERLTERYSVKASSRRANDINAGSKGSVFRYNPIIGKI